jgi:glycosyltransferase involved in cell wall biosynthesis
VNNEKIDVIYNWADESQLAPDGVAFAPEPSMSGRFNVVFAGNMGKAQSLDAVLDAAILLSESHPSIQFVFVGGGVDLKRLTTRVQAECIPNVIFLAQRPTTEIGQLLVQADVLLVHLKDNPLFKITIPSKTQASLAVGRPILMCVRGEAAALIEKIGAGITATPDEAESIAGATKRLFRMSRTQLDEMGGRGKAYYQEFLSLTVGCTLLEQSLLRSYRVAVKSQKT